MRFDIQHASATQTVSSTNGAVDGVERHVEQLAARRDGVVEALAHSASVSAAVQALHSEVMVPTGQASVQQARNVTGSTQEALQHFASGDQQMSQQGTSAEAAVNRPGMPGI